MFGGPGEKVRETQSSWPRLKSWKEFWKVRGEAGAWKGNKRPWLWDKCSSFRTRICPVLTIHVTELLWCSLQRSYKCFAGLEKDFTVHSSASPSCSVGFTGRGDVVSRMEEAPALMPAGGGASQRERHTWDARKLSELCPLKCSRGQAVGLNWPAGAELPGDAELWVWGAPSGSLSLAFLPAGPPGPSTARTLTLWSGGWTDASCSYWEALAALAPGIFLVKMLSCSLPSLIPLIISPLDGSRWKRAKFASSRDAGCRVDH